MTYGIANDTNMFSRFYLLDKLAEIGVEMLTFTTAEEITDKGVAAVDMNGERKVIEADTVAIAMGFDCNNGLEELLKGQIPEVYTIGDCVEPGRIRGAVHSAAHVARQI
jgi:2-enoate reductase